ASATVTNMIGIAGIWSVGAAQPTNATFLEIPNIGNAGVTNLEVITIAAQTAAAAGSPTNYQLRQLGLVGFNVLGGDTAIGTVSDPDFACDVTGTLALVEQAAADADIAGKGQIWVKAQLPTSCGSPTMRVLMYN
ncbi:hypothetical protein LCGC14_3012920, partial [marine sediment metagenome]